jgi:ubiquinone/menaquinone biosynthesis C-methylase UbiE
MPPDHQPSVHHSPDQSHDHSHDQSHDDRTDASLADLLDLDGQVLHSYWTDALSWVQRALPGTGPEHILDLGAGSGTGTFALARCFPGAEIIAVDASEEMLGRIEAKALDLGMAKQVRLVHADLDDAWPDLGLLDLTWASMSLHHMSQPDRVLSNVFTATRPGGLLAVAEFDEPLRFLPDDVGFGRPGLETRCLGAIASERAHSLPELGSDWAPRLSASGFAEVQERAFTIELDRPLPAGTVDYAQGWLRRLRSAAAARLDSDDQETLDKLLDGGGLESLEHSGELQVRGTRTVTLGRRP